MYSVRSALRSSVGLGFALLALGAHHVSAQEQQAVDNDVRSLMEAAGMDAQYLADGTKRDLQAVSPSTAPTGAPTPAGTSGNTSGAWRPAVAGSAAMATIAATVAMMTA